MSMIFLSSDILFNFFLQRVKVLVIQVFTWLVSGPPRYFMLSDAIMKGVYSLIFFSVSFSFVYRKDTDFFKLLLYLDTLLNMFISSRSYLVEFLGSLTYTIITSASNRTLIFLSYFYSFDLLQ